MHLLLVAKKIKRTGKEVFSAKNSKILKKWVEKFFFREYSTHFFQILVSRKKTFGCLPDVIDELDHFFWNPFVSKDLHFCIFDSKRFFFFLIFRILFSFSVKWKLGNCGENFFLREIWKESIVSFTQQAMRHLGERHFGYMTLML